MDDERACLVCGTRISRSPLERALWLDEHGVATSPYPALHPHHPDRALIVQRPDDDRRESD